ncbi:MAG: phenylacetate--CoA ligase [Deltaproteobacteria bacterium]|nr:phenylacetate--CoA ligase [Deltaproteobacteria bacterium]
MSEYWDEKNETMPIEERQADQLKSLQEILKWVYERIPFYRNAFDEKGLKPEDLKSFADLTNYPTTDKNDLRDNYPFGLCAVPIEDVIRIHASSGTTGKPVTGPYTPQDLEDWTECMARNLWAAGLRKNDICQNAYGYGLFTGGLGFHQGAVRLGCTMVPTSAGLTERQLTLMRDFGTTGLFCTPTYALTIAERAEKMGLNIKTWPLKAGVFGAEPWSEAMRLEIENRMGIVAHEAYGLTEMGGPGVAFTCSEHRLHINEDHFFPEIIDPETGNSLPEGKQGELVFTALRRQAMPLVRFRTRDISTLKREKCACGRTLIVMEKITGRFDDMLIISGVNVFPSQVESVIMEFEEMEVHYLLRVRQKGYLSSLAVEVEAKEEVYGGGQEALDNLSEKLYKRIQQVIGIHVPVTIVPYNTIARSEGKAQRVIDEREKK